MNTDAKTRRMAPLDTPTDLKPECGARHLGAERRAWFLFEATRRPAAGDV